MIDKYKNHHRCWMKIIFTVVALFLTVSQVEAKNADETMLRISLKIFPRLVAVDLDIVEKLTPTKEIRLLILYNTQKKRAEEIAQYFNEQVSNIVGISIQAIASDKLPLNDVPSGIMIIERFTEEQLIKVINYGIRHRNIVFSPFEEDVKKGVTAGMSVKIRITPCFNRSTLENSKIRIHEVLLKSSKLYD